MITGATLFSGGGGVDIGLIQAGITPLWGIELDPQIAACANDNLGGHVRVGDILTAKPGDFPVVDVLHASPPCPNFSTAKTGRGETSLDIGLARAVCRFVSHLQPRVFTLENVWLYRKSRSWRLICDALFAAGYWVHADHVNAANYGVPQTRKRMIVRAVRCGFVPALPTPGPWRGWLGAVADLVDDLPNDELAPWQMARLAKMPEVVSLFSEGIAKGAGGRDLPLISRPSNAPAYTVTANHNMLSTKILVNGGNSRVGGSQEPTIRFDTEPAFTLVSHQGRAPVRIAGAGQIKRASVRCLARWQTFPDWYRLPDNSRLAMHIIGNAVPPRLAEIIYRNLI